MSTASKIEWTEATWNPIAGCTPVSPGCLNCYAATMSARLASMGQSKYVGITVKRDGRRVFNGNISFDESALMKPMQRKTPTVYFVNSMSDLFHVDVPFDFVDRVFAVMALCPQHTFQVLTKRPERMAEYLNLQTLNERCWAWRSFGHLAAGGAKEGVNYAAPLPNVWLGTSVEDQQRADARIPHLLGCPAAVRFLSCEPLLEDIDLQIENLCREPSGEVHLRDEYPHRAEYGPAIDWIIVGGESGPGARTMQPEWARSIRDQCVAAGVAFFFKQWGGVNKKAAGRMLDGRTWDEMPPEASK